MKKQKWGFLRETIEMAEKAGIDKATGLHRTGLEEYLKVIFPDIPEKEWIHDKPFPGKRIRPDYRYEGKKMKLIIEFDGVQHYTNPKRIEDDEKNEKIYKENGYTVVRIPYFVQLTNEVVKIMFGRDVKETLFNPEIPSMSSKADNKRFRPNTPAYCCPAGLIRMAREFHKYKQQYAVNIAALEKENNETLTGVDLLKMFYENC